MLRVSSMRYDAIPSRYSPNIYMPVWTRNRIDLMIFSMPQDVYNEHPSMSYNIDKSTYLPPGMCYRTETPDTFVIAGHHIGVIDLWRNMATRFSNVIDGQ